MSTVLRPFPCYCKLCVPFLPCVNNQSLSPGSSQISRTFPIRNLQSWLHSHIRQNPFGISACITSGRRLSWPLSGRWHHSDRCSSRLTCIERFCHLCNLCTFILHFFVLACGVLCNLRLSHCKCFCFTLELFVLIHVDI